MDKVKTTAHFGLRISMVGIFIAFFIGVPATIETNGKLTGILLVAVYLLLLCLCISGNIVLWYKVKDTYAMTKKRLQDSGSCVKLVSPKHIVRKYFLPVVGTTIPVITLAMLIGFQMGFHSHITDFLFLLELSVVIYTLVAAAITMGVIKHLNKI